MSGSLKLLIFHSKKFSYNASLECFMNIDITDLKCLLWTVPPRTLNVQLLKIIESLTLFCVICSFFLNFICNFTVGLNFFSWTAHQCIYLHLKEKKLYKPNLNKISFEKCLHHSVLIIA